jgi:hypothetical protein
MAMARMSDVERWERIWRACEESVARLLGGSDPDDSELAPVIELRPVEDEPEGES